MAVHTTHKQDLINGVNNLVQRIPGMFRPMVLSRKLPEILSVLPPEFDQYTLSEIKSALHDAWNEGHISW